MQTFLRVLLSIALMALVACGADRPMAPSTVPEPSSKLVVSEFAVGNLDTINVSLHALDIQSTHQEYFDVYINDVNKEITSGFVSINYDSHVLTPFRICNDRSLSAAINEEEFSISEDHNGSEWKISFDAYDKGFHEDGLLFTVEFRVIYYPGRSTGLDVSALLLHHGYNCPTAATGSTVDIKLYSLEVHANIHSLNGNPAPAHSEGSNYLVQMINVWTFNHPFNCDIPEYTIQWEGRGTSPTGDAVIKVYQDIRRSNELDAISGTYKIRARDNRTGKLIEWNNVRVHNPRFGRKIYINLPIGGYATVSER